MRQLLLSIIVSILLVTSINTSAHRKLHGSSAFQVSNIYEDETDELTAKENVAFHRLGHLRRGLLPHRNSNCTIGAFNRFSSREGQALVVKTLLPATVYLFDHSFNLGLIFPHHNFW